MGFFGFSFGGKKARDGVWRVESRKSMEQVSHGLPTLSHGRGRKATHGASGGVNTSGSRITSADFNDVRRRQSEKWTSGTGAQQDRARMFAHFRLYILPPLSLSYQLLLLFCVPMMTSPWVNNAHMPEFARLMFLDPEVHTPTWIVVKLFFVAFAVISASVAVRAPDTKLQHVLPSFMAEALMAIRWLTLRLLWMPILLALTESLDCVGHHSWGESSDTLDCGTLSHGLIFVLVALPLSCALYFSLHLVSKDASSILERARRDVASRFIPIHGDKFSSAMVVTGSLCVLSVVVSPLLGPLLTSLIQICAVGFLLRSHYRAASFSHVNSHASIASVVSAIFLSTLLSFATAIEVMVNPVDGEVPWPFTDAARDYIEVSGPSTWWQAVIFGVVLIPLLSRAHRMATHGYLSRLLLDHTRISLVDVSEGGVRALGLSLSEYQLGSAELPQFLECFKSRNQYLRTLSLRRCGINNEGCTALLGALLMSPTLSSLRRLDLSLNQISGANAGSTVSVSSIGMLTPSGNCVDDSHGIGQFLLSSPTLQTLVLRHNNLGDSGFAPIAMALRGRQCREMATGEPVGASTTASLRKLNVEFCELSADSVELLSDVLIHNETLDTLVLNSNSVGMAGARALARSMQLHTKLRSLGLSWGRLGLQGISIIVEALASRAVCSQRNPGKRGSMVKDMREERALRLQRAPSGSLRSSEKRKTEGRRTGGSTPANVGGGSPGQAPVIPVDSRSITTRVADQLVHGYEVSTGYAASSVFGNGSLYSSGTAAAEGGLYDILDDELNAGEARRFSHNSQFSSSTNQRRRSSSNSQLSHSTSSATGGRHETTQIAPYGYMAKRASIPERKSSKVSPPMGPESVVSEVLLKRAHQALDDSMPQLPPAFPPQDPVRSTSPPTHDIPSSGVGGRFAQAVAAKLISRSASGVLLANTPSATSISQESQAQLEEQHTRGTEAPLGVAQDSHSSFLMNDTHTPVNEVPGGAVGGSPESSGDTTLPQPPPLVATYSSPPSGSMGLSRPSGILSPTEASIKTHIYGIVPELSIPSKGAALRPHPRLPGSNFQPKSEAHGQASLGKGMCPFSAAVASANAASEGSVSTHQTLGPSLGGRIPKSAPPAWRNGDATVIVQHRVLIGGGRALLLHNVEPVWPGTLQYGSVGAGGSIVSGITVDVRCNRDESTTRVENIVIDESFCALLTREKIKSSALVMSSIIPRAGIEGTDRSSTSFPSSLRGYGDQSSSGGSNNTDTSAFQTLQGAWEVCGYSFYRSLTALFYEDLLHSPLSHWFNHTRMNRMAEYNASFLSHLMSEGRYPYNGRDIKRAHRGLGIDRNAWETVISLLSQAFLSCCHSELTISSRQARRFLELFLSQVEPLKEVICE